MDLKERTLIFNRNDVVEGSEFEDFTGQILVIGGWRLELFKQEFQVPEFQLFKAEGGFGCSPTAIGTRVFGRFVSDGEEAEFRRGDFLGVLKPELVEKYNLTEKI